MILARAAVLFSIFHITYGYFKWSNCGAKKNQNELKPVGKNTSHIQFAHACEDKEPVTLSCKDGYEISILYVFFGHGYGHESSCDSSIIGQNCRTHGVAEKVKYHCQNEQRCIIDPTTKVLGTTSCVFGLDADLFIKYTCEKEHIRNTFVVNSLKVLPTPLVLPGKLSISASLSINRILPESTKLKLKIQKKVFIWTTVPCIAGYGSCTYEEFCPKLRKLIFNTCDKKMEAKGVPCDCPIPTGTFTIPTQTLTVTSDQIAAIPIPNFLVNGKYYVKAEFLDVYDRTIGCIEVYLQVSIRKKDKRALHIKQMAIH